MNFDLNTPEGMAQAKAWTERLLSTIKSGGKWIVPRSLSIYTVDHEQKIAQRTINGEPCIDRVLQEIGWTVTD